MGAWANRVIAQETYLGWMSNREGFNYFVTQVLPDVLSGSAKVLNPAGSNLGPVADWGTIIAATSSAGEDLGGLSIPQSIIENAQNPPPPPPAAPTIPTAPTGDDVLKSMLNEIGLVSLYDWAWNLKKSGVSNEAILLEMRNRPEYQQAFPWMQERAAAGKAPISELEGIAMKRQYAQVAQRVGLLPGSYDPNKAIAGDVSLTEFTDRATMASQAIYDEPPEVQAVLQGYYGLSPGQLASYYLDQANAVPKLRQMLSAGEIGGTARQIGFDVARGIAEQVAQAGFTGNSARAGLAAVAKNSPLYDESISEKSNLTTTTGVQAQFGLDAAAAKALQDRVAKRAAVSEGGGGSIVTNEGLLGGRTAR